MPMVNSGPISLGGNATTGGLNQSVNIELGRAATATIDMNESAVRTLAGVPSGAISMSNFYGKSNRVTVNLTISANTQNYNIFNNRGGTYAAGRTDVIVTVNSGVVVGSSTTAGFAMDTGTGWTSGDTIRINNNGTIVGCGGAGGGLGVVPTGNAGTAGSPGGTALRLQFATQISNAGIIGGGGGGGAGGASVRGTVNSGFYPTGTISTPGGGGAGSLPGVSGPNWSSAYWRSGFPSAVYSTAAYPNPTTFSATTTNGANGSFGDSFWYGVGGATNSGAGGAAGVSGASGANLLLSGNFGYGQYFTECCASCGQCFYENVDCWVISGLFYCKGVNLYAVQPATTGPGGGGGLGAPGGTAQMPNTTTGFTDHGFAATTTGSGITIAAGAGGAATSGAGSFATWLATGTRYGTIG